MNAVTFVQTTPDRHRSSKVALHNLKTFKMKKFIISRCDTSYDEKGTPRHWGLTTVKSGKVLLKYYFTGDEPFEVGEEVEIPEASAKLMVFKP